jgi:hypothetical protein
MGGGKSIVSHHNCLQSSLHVDAITSCDEV